MVSRLQCTSIVVLGLVTEFSCGSDPARDDGEGSTTITNGSEDPSGTGCCPSSGDDAPTTTATTTTPGDDTTTPGDDTTGDPETTGEPPMGCGDPPVWCPGPQTRWHWQLTGTLDTTPDVAMFDIDLFDTAPDSIAALQSEGRVVVCYFSAGSHEEWRPDADQFPPGAIGSPLDEWPGERWLDIRDATVRDLLAARLDLAVTKGCDGVEPDNVDGYTNDTGFPLSGADQLDFNQWLAEQAHLRGLSVGLKNDLDQVEPLLAHFDWSLNEECMAYDECDLLMPFIAAGKAVFHVEYVDDPAQGPDLAAQVCPDALDRSFSTLVKQWDLDAWGIACG